MMIKQLDWVLFKINMLQAHTYSEFIKKKTNKIPAPMKKVVFSY